MNQQCSCPVMHYQKMLWVNSLRPRRNGRYNADDIFKCIFLKENVWIPTKISLKFVPKGRINNIPALVQKMAWRRPGDKPLSEPRMESFLTHICVTWPQWVNSLWSCGGKIFFQQNAFQKVIWKCLSFGSGSNGLMWSLGIALMKLKLSC